MKPCTIIGALVIGSLSLLSLGVLPILLGGLNQAGRLSTAGIGLAAMLELFGLALGAAVGGYWMGRGAMRLKTRALKAARATDDPTGTQADRKGNSGANANNP